MRHVLRPLPTAQMLNQSVSFLCTRQHNSEQFSSTISYKRKTSFILQKSIFHF